MTKLQPAPPPAPPVVPPSVPRGTDPKLNEQGILAVLANPSHFVTPNEMRSLMSLMLMACYDRKVKREFMAEMIDRAAMMNITLSGLESEARLYLHKQEAKPVKKVRSKIVAATEIKVKSPEIEQLQKAFHAQRKTMADKFALVTQCPTSENTIS